MTIEVRERGRTIAFSFEDMMKYHGPGSPAGVAHAYKVMERAFPLLAPNGPPQRREVAVRTAFGGPGARDGFEAVTRAVTGDRYAVDAALERPERGRLLERFVFELTYGEHRVTLLLRDGYVTHEFLDLARKEGRSDEEEAQLDVLKAEMARSVMAAAAPEVYDVEDA